MVANLARNDFDSWNTNYDEMRYFFKDSDGIQMSKEFPDVRGVAIKHSSSLDYEFTFKPLYIRLYLGAHARPSNDKLDLTASEQKYLKSLLLRMHAGKARREKARSRKQQNKLAYEMAKSLKKHIK
jgi:hypothetical protein